MENIPMDDFNNDPGVADSDYSDSISRKGSLAYRCSWTTIVFTCCLSLAVAVIIGGCISYVIQRDIVHLTCVYPKYKAVKFKNCIAQDAPDTRKFQMIKLKTGQNITFEEMIHAMKIGSPILDDFQKLLREVSYDEYYFECPPVQNSTVDQDFEFILMKTDSLGNRKANRHAFQEEFKNCGLKKAVTFTSVSKFETLIAPCPPDEEYKDYNFIHLGALMDMRRSVDKEEQMRDLWHQVGTALEQRLQSQPNETWYLSTAGDAVAWTHILIGDRPKNYNYNPYRM